MQRRRRQPRARRNRLPPPCVVTSMNNQTRQPPPPPRKEARPDAPEVISTTDARAGTTGNKVRYVLLISLVIAVIGMWAVYAGSPKGTQNGPTTAPGPR